MGIGNMVVLVRQAPRECSNFLEVEGYITIVVTSADEDEQAHSVVGISTVVPGM